ncbi:MAG TPA: type II 3-dehydroquinate dehydratase [Myxococcaceae bacterium]|jgi:3-dehydroquinate dehydratase-2|nr:type II 3-dehydroquinate dehydratase [Myxococcaceae bacterium]
MNVVVLHGPNLNLLGEREPQLYGRTTLAELDARIAARAAELGLTVRCYQSNHEGSLIDFIQQERKWAQGLVINAGALTHYSWALRDAVAATGLACIEVHISDVSRRETWRQFSVFEDVRKGLVSGKGVGSYLEALELLAR